jgi:DNA mismatch repair protein MutS
MKKQTQTPMMQQFYACKKQAKEALLLFRLGDFYECFHEDAAILADALNVTLTKRHDIAMSGIPVHTLETHMQTLMKKNLVVAIAEQSELEGEQKGLIKRSVVRVESPATYYESTLIHAKNNFFAALYKINSTMALCLVDVSTAECFTMEQGCMQKLIDELCKCQVKELLITRELGLEYKECLKTLKDKTNCKIHYQESYRFDFEINYEFLTAQFKMHSLDAFGLKGHSVCVSVVGALLGYLQESLYQDIAPIDKITLLSNDKTLDIDQNTLSNLEILPSKEGSSTSLLQYLDQCQTPMGSRLLYQWLSRASLDLDIISKRHDAIETLLSNPMIMGELTLLLKPIRDIERFVKRIKSEIISPRDLFSLCSSLQNIEKLELLIKKFAPDMLKEHTLESQLLHSLCNNSLEILNEACPTRINEGGIFKDGSIKEVDELVALRRGAKEYLAALQNKLQKELGIKSLKINFNNAFGYFIQIPRAQSAKMPEYFEKRQSLVNTERFVCPELKEYEHKILTSQEQIIALEKEHYIALKRRFLEHVEALRSCAKAIGYIDTITSLAQVAVKNNLTRPQLSNDSKLIIQAARHPLVESLIDASSFIANDTELNIDNERLHIVTGPNMGGKSTYIKQVALIVLMAQAGSFVAAKKAQIGLVDKIFSRIGANDDLSRGQSTFMIEMSETANILHNATDKSLVILDEIGRGTSTYDGIALARAITEYLYKIKAKTLFATHYFELSELEKSFNAIKNYHAAVHEGPDGITFLHKIRHGSANKSYGIHVAKLSGLPREVLQNASRILEGLSPAAPKLAIKKQKQLTLFAGDEQEHPALEEIKSLKIDTIAPLKALEILNKLQESLLHS